MTDPTFIPVEEIPNEEFLFVRVKPQDINNGKLNPDALRPRTAPPAKKDDCGCKSANWSKYSCPETTLAEDESIGKQFSKCIILNVGNIRSTGLLAEHNPPPTPHSIFHSDKPQEPRRASCGNKAFAQPSEAQLDLLARVAVVYPDQ